VRGVLVPLPCEPLQFPRIVVSSLAGAAPCRAVFAVIMQYIYYMIMRNWIDALAGSMCRKLLSGKYIAVYPPRRLRSVYTT